MLIKEQMKNAEDKMIVDGMKYRPSSRRHSGEKDKSMRSDEQCCNSIPNAFEIEQRNLVRTKKINQTK